MVAQAFDRYRYPPKIPVRDARGGHDIGDARLADRQRTSVCTRNLNPNVMMMKSAKDGVRFDASDPLNWARDRGIFIQ